MFLLERQHRRNFPVTCIGWSQSQFLPPLFRPQEKHKYMEHDRNEYETFRYLTVTMVTTHVYTTLWCDVVSIVFSKTG
jgi:hypothetical protein